MNIELAYQNGITDIVSVMPPNASIAPDSTVPPGSLGKVPGVINADGTYRGYRWTTHSPTLDEVRHWLSAGANLGLRATRFPAVDIDVKDLHLAREIERIATEMLGPAPTRIGAAPKRLMLYRTDAPFARVRLWIHDGNERHLVEVLGQGQQFVVHGMHPSGNPYIWSRATIAADDLAHIGLDDVARFLTAVEAFVATVPGLTTAREGDGKIRGRDVEQDALLAPSVDAVRAIVSQIPNANERFPHRSDYLRMGYAIAAACGEQHRGDACELFVSWAMSWDHPTEKNHRAVVEEDFRRIRAPYTVGWDFLCDQARAFGVDTARFDFDVVAEKPSNADDPEPLYGTEHWLAFRAVRAIGHKLRFVAAQGRWYVWDGYLWQPDSAKLAESEINEFLVTLSREIVAQANTPEDRAAAAKLGKTFLTAQRAANIRKLLESDKHISLRAESLDSDAWKLNTPSGIVDLRTGNVAPCHPSALMSKATSVGPAPGVPVRWLAFLHEACGGDEQMVRYLQKVAGYCLTGDTSQQEFWFVWGPGGNGKSIFLSTLQHILKSYATTATMSSLTASSQDQHSTDIAMLHGARLVTASETSSERRWHAERLKNLTGSEAVTARFMRQDNFVFTPQFKLLIAGNHQPGLRDVDDGMRRRLRLVPFIIKPKVIDPHLFDALKQEAPKILTWMIEGCLAWQREGMQTPDAVRAETQEYFEQEDSIGAFLRDRCEEAEDFAPLADLFSAWREWANDAGVWVGDQKRLSGALHSRGFLRHRRATERGFRGLRLRPQQGEL